MKKRIILITSLIIIIGVVLIKSVDDKKTFKQDGVIFALTMDGETITSFPEQGKYSVDIECENGEGKWLVEEWKVAIENISGNVTCNIDFHSNPTSLKTEVESKAQTNANGYRYSGKTPNNYIWFNNEMWRIIGSIPTCTSSGCATSENLVKIIRNESIGGLVYAPNSNGLTEYWGSNSLYQLLNSYYYGALDGTGTDYCYGYSNVAKMECNYTYIGINPNGYYGKMVKNVYWNSGTSAATVNSATMFTNEKLIQTVSGYVGLMGASDYGYAASSDYHTTKLSAYNTSAITGTNWLYGVVNDWTIVQNYSYPLLITVNGNISTHRAEYGYNVRPVVYLDSTVYIVSGDGTEANPYQIGL